MVRQMEVVVVAFLLKVFDSRQPLVAVISGIRTHSLMLKESFC